MRDTQVSAPAFELEQQLGVAEAWSVVDAANAAWDGTEGAWGHTV